VEHLEQFGHEHHHHEGEEQAIVTNTEGVTGAGTAASKGHFETERYMGAALVLGFAVMFLIDQFGPSHSHRAQSSAAGGLDIEEPGKSYKSAFLGECCVVPSLSPVIGHHANLLS